MGVRGPQRTAASWPARWRAAVDIGVYKTTVPLELFMEACPPSTDARYVFCGLGKLSGPPFTFYFYNKNNPLFVKVDIEYYLE